MMMLQFLASALLLISSIEAQSSPPQTVGSYIPCYSNYLTGPAFGTSASTYTAASSGAAGQCCAVCSTAGTYYSYGSSPLSVTGDYAFALNSTTLCANAVAASADTRISVLSDGLQLFNINAFTCSVCSTSNCNVAPSTSSTPVLSVTPVTGVGATNCYSTFAAFGLESILGSFSTYEAVAEFELYGSCCAKCMLPGTVTYTNPITLKKYTLSGAIAASIPDANGIFDGTILNQCVEGSSITTPTIPGLSVSNLTCTVYSTSYGNGPAPTTILTITGGSGRLSGQPLSILSLAGLVAMVVYFTSMHGAFSSFN